MERRKYIGRANENYVKSFTSKTIRVDEENLHGYAAHIIIGEVTRPFIVGEKDAEVCLTDNGYSEINFMPDKKNWGLCAMYDKHGKIIEWYFDITRANSIDEEGNPYYDDLYLDVALMPDGRIYIFDEDELQSAHENGKITADEVNMAYRAKDDLLERKIVDIDYMESLCSKLLNLFKNMP